MALVSVGFHTIQSLCGRRQNWRLKVKLVRIWSMAAVATPDDPYAMQMLFVDEEGGRIEGTVQKHNMQKFNWCMVEGQVYKVSKFGIIRNGGKFRAVGHDYKIMFNCNTQVSPCPEASIPFLGLSFTKTSYIKKTKGSSDYLFNFMGMLTGVLEEIRLNKEERVTRLVLLDLVDDMGTIRCALFGSIFYTVIECLSLPWTGLPVVIIQLAKINIYKGWNFIIMATIFEIMDEKLWWYKLKVLASDGDDVAHFIMFDSECALLLNKSYQELLDAQQV
ncbi:Nucleic acid-binding, OB-fold [Sesbania bispinosa]|nr:Nucleic acid-binding, OB-fold [Sesbania bispinosa]